jgi:hypothetical protein
MWAMNWLAVLLAAVAGFLIGSIWYGPLFGKAWQRESGLSEESIRGANMAKVFGLAALLNLFAALVLAILLVAAFGKPDVLESTIVGGSIGLGLVTPSIGVNYLFSLKSLKLFAIDAGYWTVVYAVMASVIGLLR